MSRENEIWNRAPALDRYLKSTVTPADEPDTNAVDDALASAERRDACFAAIDAMSAEITRLQEARERTIAEYGNAIAAANDACAERDRYRAALARIAAHDDSSWQGALARIALAQG